MRAFRYKDDGTFEALKRDAAKTGRPFEQVEIPLGGPALCGWINDLIASLRGAAPVAPKEEQTVESFTPPVAKELEKPKLNETEEFYLMARQKIAEGNANLEDLLWKAPLDLAIRLNQIVAERIREEVK